MTVKLDGTNGVLQNYDYQVLTTEFTYTFAAGTQTLVINPAGTLATGTITMPAAPADGMVITIESTQQVTAVTVQGNTGQTITGAPVQLIPNQPLSFMYNLANTRWFSFNGGAGRATAVVSGTAVASTSGTSIDFTSIPSWVKRITVMFSGVSTSGTSNYLVQLGSGSVTTSGYLGSSGNLGGSASFTTGFGLTSGAATVVMQATMTISNLSGNTWVASQVGGRSDAASVTFGGGNIALAGVLDRVRITTVNGTDTFDAGSINILYE
jgi:hypothetical protein